MIILSAEKGRVCRFNLQDEQSLGTITFAFPPSVDNEPPELSPRDFSYESLHVIFDAVGLAFSPAYQLSDTLSDDILMMTFGQSITPATLRGTVLTAVCQDSIGKGVGDANSGVVRLINWWEDRNLTKRRLPARITIDKNAYFDVYVADMKLSAEETENRLWKFSLTLLRVPNARSQVNLQTSNIPAPQTGPNTLTSPGNVLRISPSQLISTPANPTVRPPGAFPSVGVSVGNLITRLGFESIERFGTVTPSNPAGFNSPNTPLVGPVSGL